MLFFPASLLGGATDRYGTALEVEGRGKSINLPCNQGAAMRTHAPMRDAGGYGGKR